MSLKKDEVEYLRLKAQKCDHRNLSPEVSFDIAADLRANRGRGGRMFEKRRNRSDKFIYDDGNEELDRPKLANMEHRLGPKPFAPQSSSDQSYGHLPDHEYMDRLNKNTRRGVPDNQEESSDPFENLTEEERLQKLYRILQYTPAEPLLPVKPLTFQGPKSDLRGTSYIPAPLGRNFNRNARGWRGSASDDMYIQEPELLMDAAARPVQLSDPSNNAGAYLDFPDYGSSLGPGLLQVKGHNALARSWHPMEVDVSSPQEDIRYGDYNPRPKAWRPMEYDMNSPSAGILFGDYNPRPKAWNSSQQDYLDGTRQEIIYGDYNARPKAWESSEDNQYPGDVQYGDYNARPKAWQSSGSTHYIPPSEVKYGDYNARAKAWKTSRLRKLLNQRDMVRYRDYNARPKGWHAAHIEDSDSSSTSTDEETFYFYRFPRAVLSPGEIPASDV